MEKDEEKKGPGFEKQREAFKAKLRAFLSKFLEPALSASEWLRWSNDIRMDPRLDLQAHRHIDFRTYQDPFMYEYEVFYFFKGDGQDISVNEQNESKTIDYLN